MLYPPESTNLLSGCAQKAATISNGTVREAEVPLELSILYNMTELLLARVDALTLRLGPVMRSEPIAAGKEDQPSPTCTQFGESIHENRTRVGMAIESINRIMDLLEV